MRQSLLIAARHVEWRSGRTMEFKHINVVASVCVYSVVDFRRSTLFQRAVVRKKVSEKNVFFGGRCRSHFVESMHTPHGKAQSDAYNQNIRFQTLRFAVLEQLRAPSPGFADVIRTHFRLKRDLLREQMSKWIDTADRYVTHALYKVCSHRCQSCAAVTKVE